MIAEARLAERLSNLDRLGQRRTLRLAHGLDFSSNDYLGFAHDEVLRSRTLERLASLTLGSTGSRLLSGNLSIHEAVEDGLAKFCETETATLFASGYQANLGLLSAILTPTDHVFADELNHASLIDGVRISRANKHIFKHSDVAHLRERLEEHRHDDGLNVILTESIFSMDGDIAPLEKIAALAEEFNALLVVDEAHGTGLYGKGSGLVSELGLKNKVFATIHTGGKSFGAGGAWVAGNSLLKDTIVNFSRGFIFSTAPTPFLAASLDEARKFWMEFGESRAKAVRERCKLFREALGLEVLDTPVIPVILGDNRVASEASTQLQAQGFDIRAIRPPTVPEGTARFRITLKWANQPDDLRALITALKPYLPGGTA